MNKRLVIGFSSILAVLLLSILVSAAESPVESLKSAGSGFLDVLQPLFETILGDSGSTDILFAKVLFFLILFGILYSVLDKIEFFEENYWVLIVVSLGASILSVRWLGEADWIQSIILPYSAMGIAITAGLPFVLYFLLIDVGLQQKSGMIRRFAWIFFAVIFVGLWFTRYDEIQNAAWIYPATAALAFLMAIMDGTIQGFLIKLKLEKVGKTYKGQGAMAIQKQMNDISALYNGSAGGAAYVGGLATIKSKGKTGTEAYLADMAELEKQFKKILK